MTSKNMINPIFENIVREFTGEGLLKIKKYKKEGWPKEYIKDPCEFVRLHGFEDNGWPKEAFSDPSWMIREKAHVFHYPEY